MAVYRTISNGLDQEKLQQDLHCVAEWEKTWNMEFHPANCQTLSVSRSRSPLDYPYELHGHTLEAVPSVKYLCITIHLEMSWDHHINNICNKANQTLEFLRWNLQINNTSIKERANKALV